MIKHKEMFVSENQYRNKNTGKIATLKYVRLDVGWVILEIDSIANWLSVKKWLENYEIIKKDEDV